MKKLIVSLFVAALVLAPAASFAQDAKPAAKTESCCKKEGKDKKACCADKKKGCADKKEGCGEKKACCAEKKAEKK